MSSIERVSALNDPEEALEVLDAAGRPTGVARSRAAIHLGGDWHKAFHCWILRHGGQEVVLQRRSLLKDTFPGYWDAAAAGHWRFRESPAEAAREISEELGICVSFDELIYRGRERMARRYPNGLIEREFHEVYVLGDDRPLTDYRPDPKEVSALAAFPLRSLIEVATGKRESLVALEPAGIVVTRRELVPYSAARLRRNLVLSQSVVKL